MTLTDRKDTLFIIWKAYHSARKTNNSEGMRKLYHVALYLDALPIWVWKNPLFREI
jgi:hypothetical protein